MRNEKINGLSDLKAGDLIVFTGPFFGEEFGVVAMAHQASMYPLGTILEDGTSVKSRNSWIDGKLVNITAESEGNKGDETILEISVNGSKGTMLTLKDLEDYKQTIEDANIHIVDKEHPEYDAAFAQKHAGIAGFFGAWAETEDENDGMGNFGKMVEGMMKMAGEHATEEEKEEMKLMAKAALAQNEAMNETKEADKGEISE